MGLRIFKGELGCTMTACLKEDASAWYRHGNTFGSWSTKTRRDQALRTAALGTTRSTHSRQGDYDRAVGRHHDKTLFKADFGDTGSEDWFGESCHRSCDIRSFARLDPNSSDCSALSKNIGERRKSKQMTKLHKQKGLFLVIAFLQQYLGQCD